MLEMRQEQDEVARCSQVVVEEGVGGYGKPGGPDPTLCLSVQHAFAVSGWGAFSRATVLEVSAVRH